MTHRQLKIGYLALAWINTIATTYFFYFLFFLLRDRFGFSDRDNLCVSALHGFIYIFAAWQCGKFAQRRGYVSSLKLGYLTLTAAMIVGAFLNSAAGLLVLVAAYSVVLLLTWPALEALVSERETRAGTQRMVGIYNCTWAGAGALAYFTGGKLYDALGHAAIFWVPAALFAGQFLFTLWLDKHHDAVIAATPAPPMEAHHTPEAAALRQTIRPDAFLKMAWLANPFAYIALNTIIAVMPGVAGRLALSPTQAGWFGSVWFFARVAAFALLWRWTGWHYRFRWLLASFLMLIGSFVAVLLARDVWLAVLAQVVLGLAAGLIYYSSLFYAMDVGETKGEHGGLHEAFIGLGIFLGPATGAAALQFAPQNPNAGTWAVTALLTCGLGGLLWLRSGNKS
jgi:predicted MFS family arabinose efflux permease